MVSVLTVCYSKISGKSKNIAGAALLLLLGLLGTNAYSQGEKSTIQLSGIVVAGEESYGVPGVHIYVERAGRGTATNHVGFFTMPTIIGDTVTISAVGYAKQRLIVPERDDIGFTVLIDLKEDTTFLPVIEVFPYPTREIFEEAFLALNLKDERMENMERNLNKDRLLQMYMDMPMDGSSNHRNFMNQQMYQHSNRNFAPSFSFLNPFAWAEFIKSVRRGDLKKKEYRNKD